MFGRIATPRGGWLFGAVCDRLTVGSVVRLQLPGPLAPDQRHLSGTGRVAAVDRPRRLVIEQALPWPARLTCVVAPVPSRGGEPRCRVRLLVEVPERAIRWLLRRRGEVLDPEVSGDEQPIGLLISQSGPGSVFAGAAENLAQMAIEEVNAEGPPLGRALRLVIGDDGTSSALSALEARRLVTAEGCPIVVAGVTSLGFAAASAALRDEPALLIFSVTNEGGPTGDRLIRLGERPAAQIAGAVSHVMSSVDGRRWFLAGNDYSWPRATNACAVPILDRAGARIVGRRELPLGSTDMGALLEAIDRSGAECILSTFVGADAAAFQRALHFSGLAARCRTLAPAMDEATLEHIGPEAGAGISSVFGYYEQLPTPENRGFLRRYRERFGALAPPPSSLSESVYESVHLVVDAARRARSWHPTEVGRAMAVSRFRGPRGKVGLAGPDGLHQELFLAEATGGAYAVRAPVGMSAPVDTSLAW